jgi:hypothetical protein
MRRDDARCPPHASPDLALRNNQLLPQQGVFGQEGGTVADKVSDQSEGKPQEVDHPGAIACLVRRRNL